MATVDTISHVTDNAARWGMTPVARSAAPVKERVVAALREAILEFKVKPGERLVEREIMQGMDVSRATVREALSVLASEGLVTVVPQKGAHVAVPSADDAADLYEVRAALESLVVRRFIERATDDEVGLLQDTVGLMQRELDQDTGINSFLRAKDQFYAVLDSGARSASLSQLLASIQARVRMLRLTSLSTPDRLPHVVTEMHEIVDAIAHRNIDRASRLMTEHIQMASTLALSALHRQA